MLQIPLVLKGLVDGVLLMSDADVLVVKDAGGRTNSGTVALLLSGCFKFFQVLSDVLVCHSDNVLALEMDRFE